jgi:hypothetical protein
VSLSGSGTVTLNNANSYLQGYSGPSVNTLVNQSTVNGQGFIYNVTLDNQGTIDANSSGGTLYIYSAPTTNSGVLRADAGATLNLNNSTLANFASTGSSAGTLSGGTYEVFSGTLSFNNGGFTNDIVTSAATIVLDGTAGAPKLLDQNGNNALANFATNTAAGSFTIQNGVSLATSSSGFSNAGTVNIGANSSLTVGGSNDYVQSGGTTTLGTPSSQLFVASGHSVDINGGTLQGFGTIQGNLSNNGGLVMPGVTGTAGVLTVTGYYTDPPSSHLFIQIGGPDTQHGLAQLDLGGTAYLNNGTLDVSLIDGFTPTNGELFTILTSSGLSGTFNDNSIHDGNVTFTVEYSPVGFANDVVLRAQVSSIPEPSSWVLLGLGMVAAGVMAARRSSCRADTINVCQASVALIWSQKR